jgi:branched-chain amino acid transport system substrate-binding protein
VSSTTPGSSQGAEAPPLHRITYSAEAYDAANTVISVMKSIGANVSRAAVVSGLRTVDYKGLTKTVQFQSNGDISGTAVYIYQVKSGKITVLGLVSKLAK